MKKVSFDVMIMGGAKYYCTLVMNYNPRHPIDEKTIKKFVIRKRPTLKYQPFTIAFNN